jgi:adhesin transport system outer membrane protein
MIRLVLALLALLGSLAPASGLAQGMTLREVMLAAVASSPNIKAKARDLEAAESVLSGAEWGRYPSVNMSMTTNRIDASSSNNPNSGPTSILTVEQPIYSWGGIEARIDTARLQRDIARRAFETETNLVTDRVIAAFTELQRAQERLLIQEEAIVRLREFKAMIERRIATQLSSNNDAALVESRLRQSLTDVTLTRSVQERARNQLAELTGQSVRSVQAEQPRRPSLSSRAAAEQATLDTSPELASSRLQVDVATMQRAQRKADIFPRVVARAETLHTYNSSLPNDTRFYIALVGNLGSGLAQIDSLAEASARILSAEQSVETARRSLTQLAGSTWAEMEAYEAQLPDLAEVARQNEDIVASFIRQYIAGRKTWLDVLNAERELTQSRLALGDARAGTISAEARMSRLAGLTRFSTPTSEQQ